MKWKKLGHVFCPDGHSETMVSYARIPIADHVGGNLFDIYFGSRDAGNRERVFKVSLDMNTLDVNEVVAEHLLDFGEVLGAFDDNGVTPCCIVNRGETKYLYYAGWNIHVKIPFTCAVGLAESTDNGKSYKKLFKGAVLDRNKDDFQFVAVNDVLWDEGLYRTWYLSCVEWFSRPGQDKPGHSYHIRYAESDDGIHWRQDGKVAINFKNEFEYAISTPRVIKDSANDYKMWYSFRAQNRIDTYRIGYATSKDGIDWVRMDEEMNGFDVSKDGWDSEMVCYPFVFDHNDARYMLYNGNGYGRTGFGLAILERD